MYKKLVSYFEKNWCIDNIYFRKYGVLWIGTIILTIENIVLLNKVGSILIENVWIKALTVLIVLSLVTFIIMYIYYLFPKKKIYEEKINKKLKYDILSFIMHEEGDSAYQEKEIEGVRKFLKNEISKKEDINNIIIRIDEDIKENYNKIKISEKLIDILLNLTIVILSVYFTNNDKKDLVEIITTTITIALSVIIPVNLISIFKEPFIIPISKKKNLLELKGVLLDVQIDWDKETQRKK